jgi:glycine/D-amino acid oxidase-like deaminating enzyme
MQVIIVGAGIMGLCTAWALTRAGHDVRVLEQGHVPNPLGSSVDESRMTRHLYGDLPGYGPMVDDARAAYAELFRDLGQTGYRETGVLALSSRAGDWTDESRRQLARQGHAPEILDGSALHRRFPFLTALEVRYGLLLAKGGLLLAGQIVGGLAAWLGERVRPHSQVVALDPDAAAVTLADGSRLQADRLVVAAGPWLAQLLPAFATRVVSHRQVVVFLQPPEDLREAWASAPCIVDFGAEDALYLLPPSPTSRLKVGWAQYRRPGAPDERREVGGDEPHRILAEFRPHLARLDEYRVLGAQSCCYSMTADQRFIVEPLGARGWVASPCSGHGFKFGAVIGQRLAAGVTGALAPDALAAWAAGLATVPADG